MSPGEPGTPVAQRKGAVPRHVAAPEADPLVDHTGLSAALQTPSTRDFDRLVSAVQTHPDFIRSGQDFGTATVRVDVAP